MSRKKTIIEHITESGLIEYGDVIVAGVSGGPDSLCMLHALTEISDLYNLSIVPVHVNHKLRPEADEEEERVVEICDKLDLECNVYAAECTEVADELKISTEEAGRLIRYEIFDEAAEEICSEEDIKKERVKIAVAHNADDQSETVLFRLIRGTGPDGLTGMPAARATEGGFMLIRPLLGATRAEIEKYISKNKLKPNIDKSNEGTDYTRNKIRNELIPYLEREFNPNIKDALRRFAEIAAADSEFLAEITYSICAETMIDDEEAGKVTLNITPLRELPPAITTRIAMLVLSFLGLETDTTYELVTNMASMIYSDNPSSVMNLPKGYKAIREYDTITYVHSGDEEIIRADDSLRMIPQVMMTKEFNIDEDDVYAAFDFDEFNKDYPGRVGELVMRTRREGDFIAIKNGSKKIQDVLVDCKVKKAARDSILMVAIDDEILWILPSLYFDGEQERDKGKFTQKYRINKSTKRVLFIEITENI